MGRDKCLKRDGDPPVAIAIMDSVLIMLTFTLLSRVAATDTAPRRQTAVEEARQLLVAALAKTHEAA